MSIAERPNPRIQPTAPPLASLAPALRLMRKSLGGISAEKEK